MIRKDNGQVHLTGQDEVIFGMVLFMMNLFLDMENTTRGDVNRAIYYFRDMGLPLNEWLFNHIIARWDTRLAWGTPARIISFPLDERDPAGGQSIIHRARRREMWHRMSEAVGGRTTVSAPPWLRNTPEFSGDLPSGDDAILTIIADVLGTELLARLTEKTEQGAVATPVDDAARSSKAHSSIAAVFDRLRNDPEIEVGFHQS